MSYFNWMRLSSLQCAAAVVALLALPALGQNQATPAEKTAEQVFQNIQVFKGKPANELRPTMSFIASSLGVGCNFCHAQPFSADTKPEKATARKMIQMVYSINQESFGGRNQINCYTCHQGHSRPTSTLTIAADMPPGAAGPGGGPGGPGGGPGGQGPGAGRGAAADLPTAQQLLDKYVAAIGGAEALGAIHSESITSERSGFGSPAPETVVRADGKMLISDGANTKSGFDGSAFWSWSSRGGLRDLGTDTIGQLQTDVELYPGAGLKAEGARVFGKQKVGDSDAYVVAVRTATGAGRYYFDAASGLLVRYVTSTPTFLGSLPLQLDYSDYRSVEGGAKLPFDVKWSTHERTAERKVSAIAINGSVDGAGFSAPAGAAGGQ